MRTPTRIFIYFNQYPDHWWRHIFQTRWRRLSIRRLMREPPLRRRRRRHKQRHFELLSREWVYSTKLSRIRRKHFFYFSRKIPFNFSKPRFCDWQVKLLKKNTNSWDCLYLPENDLNFIATSDTQTHSSCSEEIFLILYDSSSFESIATPKPAE